MNKMVEASPGKTRLCSRFRKLLISSLLKLAPSSHNKSWPKKKRSHVLRCLLLESQVFSQYNFLAEEILGQLVLIAV